MKWDDYLLFRRWLKGAEENDIVCIQTGNDGKYILKLIKHEKEENLCLQNLK